MPEGHPHCQNAWTKTTIIRYLIADNRAFGSIHDKPDIGFDTTDFDVCLISSKYIASFGFNAGAGWMISLTGFFFD